MPSPLEKSNLHIAALVIGLVGALLLVFSSFRLSLGQSKYRLKVNGTQKMKLPSPSGKTDTYTLNTSYMTSQTWGISGNCISSYDHTVNGSEDTNKSQTTCHAYSATDFESTKKKDLWASMFSMGYFSWAASVVFIILLFVSLFHMQSKNRQSVRWGTMGVGLFLVACAVATLAIFTQWNKCMVKSKFLPASQFKGEWSYGPGMYSTSAGITLVAVATILTGVTTRGTTQDSSSS